MRPITDFDPLPQFLIADDGDNRFFVVHCHAPRFVMEFDDDGPGTPQWIDDASDLDVAAGAKLMREAGDFFSSQINRQ